jgi:S1-C subfamily serine protease
MLKNILKIIVIFIFGMAGGIFADQIFWPYFVEKPLFFQYRLDKPPVYIAETKEIRITENIALQEAVLKVEKAVVGIRTQTTGGKTLDGSGLIVTSDGLMVTLNELLPAGSKFSFFVYGNAVPFKVLKREPEKNLALVKLEADNFKTVGFADLEKLRVGQRVFLVAKNPSFEGGMIVNEGIVKAFDENSIQTNIFEEARVAGSPLFDIEGRFLGLTKINKKGQVSVLLASKIRTFLGF